MKKSFKQKSIYLILFCFMAYAPLVLADTPAPPPPGGGHGQSGNGPPVGAPIDGGLGILIAMGAIYGGKRLYKAYKVKQKNVTSPDLKRKILIKEL